MTIRDELAKGPKFEPETLVLTNPEGARTEIEDFVCETCGACAKRDKTTGLCRPCWRVWRFAQDDLHALGVAVWRGLAGKVFHKVGGTALEFGEFGLYLVNQAGGFDRFLAEWEPGYEDENP